ncbi:hypothetical protein QQ045_012962 [Rhodiola kirilowii]
MTCEVEAGSRKFGLIMVYASNKQLDRKQLWEDIGKVGKMFAGNWLCIGDFNCVKDQREKLNGNRVKDGDTMDFRKFLENTKLHDLPASGYHYTWSNNSVNSADRIWCKLDRALGNEVWFKEMEDAQACFHPPGISNHCPVMVYWGHEKKITRSFRYCNFWENLEDYEEAVRSSWNNGIKCTNMFLFQSKLKSMKQMLKQKFVGRTRGMDIRVNLAREALFDAQGKTENNPSDAGLCEEERRPAAEFRKIKYNQFLFNKQRTHAQWIKEGDVNNKFFHSLLKSRRARNKISHVSLRDGSMSTDSGIIKKEISEYFKDLLGQARQCSRVDADAIAFGPMVSGDQCRLLVRGATDKEIWSALSNIGNDKAPGPDGFSSSFFKRNWSIVGRELCEGIRHCLRHNALPRGMNAAYIALIPKSNQCAASKPEDYRPISCCNVTYKIISSLLAGRLKEVMPDIIDPAQGAFVKDRSIVGNICLAQQLLSGYGRKNVSGRMAWKIDLRKAYDTIDWSFITSMLEKLKFPSKFIAWMVMCIQSTSYSVMINGEMIDFFPGKRGLRQGDPLSPFLFNIAMECLSRMMNRLNKSAGFYYHPKCHRIKLSHIMFADDLILFSSGRSSAISAVKGVVNEFLNCSGLAINFQKSHLFTGGMSDAMIT